jgi:translation initiation factor 2 subunit 3
MKLVYGNKLKNEVLYLHKMTELRLSEIIKNQAIFNCGTAGHVMHGKSTLVCNMTGTKTQRYQKEKEKNITIKLGYANCKFYLNQSTQEVVVLPTTSGKNGKKVTDAETGEELIHLSTISFVDCPGHELYMATMVSGSKIMDYAIVVVAANEIIPQPQTHHHIVALDYSHINDMSFVLNKVDLIREKDLAKVKQNLDTYLKDEVGIEAPVVYPISAATGENVSELAKLIASKVYNKIPDMLESANKPLRMNIVRSYNVNKPSTKLEDLVGAVVGGTIESGVLSVGDQIEMRPGIICMKNGKKVIQPLVGKVLSLESDHNSLEHAIPGGLVGVNLSIYSGLSNNDRLKGYVMGHYGSLPDMYDELSGKYKILDIRTGSEKISSELPTLQNNMEIDLVVNGIMNVKATITGLKQSKKSNSKGTLHLKTKTPVVLNTEESNSIAIMIDRKLTASLTVKEASLSIPIVYPENVDKQWTSGEFTIVNDLPTYSDKPSDFEQLSENISTYRSSRIKKETYPYPDVKIVNRNSIISGPELDHLINSLSYSQVENQVDLKEIMISNISKEFTKSSPRFNGDGSLVLDGRFRKDQFIKFIERFCSKLLKCPSCRSTRCTLTKENTTIKRTCQCCPAVTFLHTTDMGKI